MMSSGLRTRSRFTAPMELRSLRRLAGALLAGLLGLLLVPGFAPAQPAAHVRAELVAQGPEVAPGQTVYLALRQVIDEGWHTYWRNPGDSGEATKIEWTLPAGWKAGEILWPTPERHPTGPLMNYGYAGEVLLPVPLTAPAVAQPGERVLVRARATFLVCKDICIPEEASLETELRVAAEPGAPKGAWSQPISTALAALPKPAGLKAAFASAEGEILLSVTGEALVSQDLAGAYFYPFEGGIVDPAKPQAIERGPSGLTLTLPLSAQAGAVPAGLGGVLALRGAAYEIDALPGGLDPAARGLGPPPAGDVQPPLGLAAAAIFALLGGLILNLMPCVFPILAMKAASLAGHGSEAAAARRQGLAFLAGVLVTFLALAGVLIGMKAAGAAVGWGFQLQSPVVVAALALLMLAVALNLAGLFEVGSAVQGAGNAFASRAGAIGAFFTGALAVVVAAPCTAPFMAPALGWALTQPAHVALVVFAFLGLGFAAPFVAVSFAPALFSKLPRPGPWMETFRRAMAFPMLGASAWLVWVLSVQTGSTGLARLLAACVLLGLGAWCGGLAQRRRLARGSRGPAALISLLAVAGALGTGLWPGYEAAVQANPAPQSGGPGAPGATIAHEPYSPERLSQLRGEGRVVLVNYTAAWCVTCQVNERVALSTQPVADALAKTGAAYLVADWTSRDAGIAAELEAHGRAGVPLYLLWRPGDPEPTILPQLLTPGLVVDALETASRPGSVAAGA